MIEFSPNPTGPSHLGTIRTYIAAWDIAKERGQRLSVRFDGEMLTLPLVGGHGRTPSKAWAELFLGETYVLGMPPDAWIYLEDSDLVTVDVFREGVETKPWPNPSVMIDEFAYIKSGPIAMNDTTVSNWKAEGQVPILNLDGDSTFPYAFHKRDGKWIMSPVASHMMISHFRGVKTIVRSLISERVTSTEIKFASDLGMPMEYEAIHHAVIVNDEGALSKSRLETGDPGTLGWAVGEYGMDEVKRCLQKSLLEDDRPIIHYLDLFRDS